MNKTLLLILCDFLLLSLLALTRWEDARPAPAATASPVPASTAASAGDTPATPETDLVAVMRLSLEEEEGRRLALSDTLARTEAAKAELEQTRDTLAENLARTERTAADLDRERTAALAAAAAVREQADALARDLAAKETEARLRAEELAKTTAAEAAARSRAEQLAVAVGVATREKELLLTQTETLRAAVQAERAERERVQAAAAEIAQKTDALAREIREARPINANTLFQDFLARRLQARFSAARSSFLGPVQRELTPRTILASDGRDVVALFHVDDSPIDFRAPTQPDWEKFELHLSRATTTYTPPRLDFASLDGRILYAPVPAPEVTRLGVEPYHVALDPFKFPEAVLISAGGAGYGELPFKLDPRNPGYVQVDNRLFRRLTGDFSPSRGDLVFSKTGELLGLMVSADACALINNFLPQRSLPLGPDLRSTPTGPVLDAVARRVQFLPSGVK